MGLFDYVYCHGPEFVCSEGHDLSGEEFQTKDLGCTMGSAKIGGGWFSHRDGGWGDSPPKPMRGEVEIYCSCPLCPVFVQAETFNIVSATVEFSVVIENDRVTSVRRISPSTAEFIEKEPSERYMGGCRGPMSLADAKSRRDASKFFPWDPAPAVSKEAAEAQRAHRESLEAHRKRWAKKQKTVTGG